ncbi:MAG: hypothetical protein ACUVRU_12225 [Anaerolineae bacterium]
MQLTASYIEAPYRSNRECWAERLSIALSPPVVGAAGLLATAISIGTPAAWAWLLADIVLAIVLPLLFVVWLVRKGHISDIDLRQREQRAWPYRVAIACALIATGLSALLNAPRVLAVMVGALAAQTLILWAITTRWKISLHAAAIAGGVVVAGHLAGPIWLASAALVPVVCWARVTLGRHSLAQTIAGALVGGAVYTIACLLVSLR